MLKLNSVIQSFNTYVKTTIYKTSRNKSFDAQELSSYHYNFFEDDGESFKLDFLKSVKEDNVAHVILGTILKINELTKESNHSLDITKEVYKLWIIYHDVQNGIQAINQILNAIIDDGGMPEINVETFSMIHKLLPGIISIPRLIGKCSDTDEFSYSFNKGSWRMNSISEHGEYVESLINEVPLMMQFIETENGKDDETFYSSTILNGAIVLLGNLYEVIQVDDREHLRVYFNMLARSNILVNGFVTKGDNIKTTKEQFVINGSVAYSVYDDCDRFEVFNALPEVGFAVSKWSTKANPINPRYTSLMTWVNPEGNFRYLKVNRFSEEI
jgi:hypothetical protein